MEPLSPTSRLFTAVPVSAPIIQMAREYRELCGPIPGVRWMPEENYHVTLYFMGNVLDADQPELEVQLTDVAHSVEPFSIQFEAFIPAGHPSRPSMIWARFHRNVSFTRLSGMLRTHCERFALQTPALFPDPIPHITLARTSRHGALKMIPEFHELLPGLNISQLGLWKTHQIPDGVKYEQLRTWQLGPPQ
jgi:2'-5' RNA ligase